MRRDRASLGGRITRTRGPPFWMTYGTLERVLDDASSVYDRLIASIHRLGGRYLSAMDDDLWRPGRGPYSGYKYGAFYCREKTISVSLILSEPDEDRGTVSFHVISNRADVRDLAERLNRASGVHLHTDGIYCGRGTKYLGV